MFASYPQGGSGNNKCAPGYNTATAIRMIDPVVLTAARANNVSRCTMQA